MKSLLLSLALVIQLTGCSTSGLQSGRLDSVETYLSQAEQSFSANRKMDAVNNLGTAKAYLGTLRDYKKFLSKEELQRYQALNRRATELTKRIN